MDTQTLSRFPIRLTACLVLAVLLALAVLSGCATARQVAADHPVATRIVANSLAVSAVATAAKVGK